MIPSISFLCIVIIAVVWTFLFSYLLLKLYSYSNLYSHCPWCEQAFTVSTLIDSRIATQLARKTILKRLNELLN